MEGRKRAELGYAAIFFKAYDSALAKENSTMALVEDWARRMGRHAAEWNDT